MTKAEIQNLIFEQTGIKTSVKKLTGSQKEYICFSPMFQNGNYPQYPFEWRRAYMKTFPETEPPSIFVNGTQITIHKSLITGDPIKYKKESKPKTIDQMKVKEWGSKNSQLRLDKAASRHAKKVRQGKNTVRYW